MKCRECGQNISSDTSYCPNCGYEIINEDPKVRFSRAPIKYDGPKKLSRSRKNRLIAGVCGGIEEYYGFNAWLVRLAFIFAIFLPTIGIYASFSIYMILIIIIKESTLDPWSE